MSGEINRNTQSLPFAFEFERNGFRHFWSLEYCDLRERSAGKRPNRSTATSRRQRPSQLVDN